MVHLFKRFKLNLVHGAYALALLATFAFKPANVDTGLHWFGYDDDTGEVGTYIGTTTGDLEAHSCMDTDEAVICALGFSPGALINPSAPIPELIQAAIDDPLDYNSDERTREENP